MIKLLIVEDQLGQLIASLLNGFNGFEAKVVKSGDQAIREFLRDEYDVILMDLRLPGLDGLSAIKEIRDVDDDVPIIVLTAYQSYREKSIKAGADDFFIKPPNLRLLASTIHKLAAKAKGQSGSDHQLLLRQRKTKRLQKLQEQQAVLGVNTPPEILIEIEELEEELNV